MGDQEDEGEKLEAASPSSSSKRSSNLSNQQVISPNKSSSKEIQTRSKVKTKTKSFKKKKDVDDVRSESTIFIDPEDQCVRHSFCVIKTLKEKGVQPLKPKGLPWSTGLLRNLPGHKPPDFENSKQGQAEIAVKKKKRLKQKLTEKKRIMKRLREGDHKKLCNVLNTSQELMILMRIMSLYAEKRRVERNQVLNGIQTEFETITEEEEEEDEETEKKTYDEEGEENGEDDEEGEDEELGLPENFLETE